MPKLTKYQISEILDALDLRRDTVSEDPESATSYETLGNLNELEEKLKKATEGVLEFTPQEAGWIAEEMNWKIEILQAQQSDPEVGIRAEGPIKSMRNAISMMNNSIYGAHGLSNIQAYASAPMEKKISSAWISYVHADTNVNDELAGNPFSICTYGAKWLQEHFFPEGVIMGYFHADNPTAEIEDHDFLVVGDIIIDFWYKVIHDQYHPPYVIKDSSLSKRLYGDSSKWVVVS